MTKINNKPLITPEETDKVFVIDVDDITVDSNGAVKLSTVTSLATRLANISATLTAGFNSTYVSDGNQGNSTYTPTFTTGNYRTITNDGPFTFNPPTVTTGQVVSLTILLLNTTGAGAISTTNFDAVIGDPFTTTTTDNFMCYIDVYNVSGTSYSVMSVTALQ